MAKRKRPPSEGKPGDEYPEFFYEFRYRAEARRTYDLASSHDELIEEDAFIVEIEGDVIFAHEPMAEGPRADPMVVGRVTAQILRLPDALEAGFRAYDVFDVHSGDLEAIGRALFFEESRDRMKPAARKIFTEGEPVFHNVLVVENVALAPEHRRRGVGLVAVHDLMTMFGDSFGAILTIPASTEELPGERDRTTARKKLQSHVEHLGFRRIGRSEVWALSAIHVNPPLGKALAAYRTRRHGRD